MIEVAEAIKIINDAKLELPAVDIPTSEAVDKILREDIVADTDFPPFDRVMMDGIAVAWNDFDEGIREFDIKGVQSAGSPQMSLMWMSTRLSRGLALRRPIWPRSISGMLWQLWRMSMAGPRTRSEASSART